MTDELSNLLDDSLLPDAHDLMQDAAEQRGAQRELLIVKAGARLFSVFAEDADGICDWRAPVPLPGAPPCVLGVAGVRGRMLTVLDPLLLLDERAINETSQSGFIVALRGDEQLALCVNKALRIIEIYEDQIEPPLEGAGVVRGHIQSGSETITVLNVQEMFAAAMQGTERRRQR